MYWSFRRQRRQGRRVTEVPLKSGVGRTLVEVMRQKQNPPQPRLRRVRRALAGFITRPQAVDQIGARVGTLLLRWRVCQCSCSRDAKTVDSIGAFFAVMLTYL